MTQGDTLLLVEDCALLSWALADVLRLGGFETVHATSRAEACALLERARFSAVLLDFRLPDGNGLEVFRAARRNDPTVPVLLLSGYPPEHMISQLLPDASPKRLVERVESARAAAQIVELDPNGVLLVEAQDADEFSAALQRALGEHGRQSLVVRDRASVDTDGEVAIVAPGGSLLDALDLLSEVHPRRHAPTVVVLPRGRRAQRCYLKPVEPEELLAELDALRGAPP